MSTNVDGEILSISGFEKSKARPNFFRRNSAVSFAFSPPLQSITTAESGQVIRNGTMQPVPLPAPVGAKTAVCTACDSRTRPVRFL